MRIDVKSLVSAPTMRSKRFFVRGRLPALNEYSKAPRGDRFHSARMKREAEDRIMWEIRSQLRGWKTDKPVFLHFLWREKDRRRDHDNVAFAKKFVQDSLVKTGVLQGDGWKYVLGFVDEFCVCKENPGVEVTILEVLDDE